MSLLSKYLESVDGIEVWFIISLLIFFTAFIIFLVRILRKSREEMEMIKNSILDDYDSN